MGIYAKILAILNVLAAIGFLCLAALDYGKRQAWSFAVLEQDYLLQGLPVDEKQLDVNGRPVVESIGRRLVKDLGTSFKTQKDEVEKRHQDLKSKIEGLGNEQQQREQLAAILVPLAPTAGQREELRQKIATDKIESLLGPDGPFEAAFRPALQGRTSAGQELDLDQRRRAIAHLLFGVSAPEEYQRALNVTGLVHYALAVNDQASNLAAMAGPIRDAITTDRSQFEGQYKTVLQEIILQAQRIRDLNQDLQNQITLREQHAALARKRQEDVSELQKQIQAAKEAVKMALAAQSDLEQQLFDSQKAVVEADQKNQQLEQALKTHELTR